MTSEEIKELSKMKKLIAVGKRKFQVRPDRDYLQDLLEFGITEEEAWNWIITLNSNYYLADTRPLYYGGGNALLFKRDINGIIAYIKLIIRNEVNGEEVVCLSFHRDKFN